MMAPLYYEPVLRLDTAPHWTRALAARFRSGLGGRGHIVLEEASRDLAETLPSLAVTRPRPPLPGWATPSTWAGFTGPVELEAPFPTHPDEGERLAFWMRHGQIDHLRLTRPPASLAALDAGLAWVPGADLPVSLELASFGTAAAFWLLARRPAWRLYGPGALAPALAVAAMLGRTLWIADRSGAPPVAVTAPPQPACPALPGPDPRHPPVPATWL